MGSRNIPDIQYRLLTFLLLFLLQLLLVGNPPVSPQIRQIDKADIGKAALLCQLIQLILKLRIVQHSLIIKLADCLHGLMHAVIADTDIIGQLKHLACLALRPAADKADVFIFTAVSYTHLTLPTRDQV